MQLMIDSPAVTERNVLIPLTLDELFRAFQGIGMNEAPDVMLFIEKICNFEFLHLDTLLPTNNDYSTRNAQDSFNLFHHNSQ